MADFPGDARERVLFEGQRVFIIVNAAGALALGVPQRHLAAGRRACR